MFRRIKYSLCKQKGYPMLGIICIVIDVVCAVILALPVFTDRFIVPVMSEEGVEYRLRKVSAMFRLQGSTVLYIGLSLIAVSIVLAVMGLVSKKYSALKKIATVFSLIVIAFTVIMMLTAGTRSIKY